MVVVRYSLHFSGGWLQVKNVFFSVQNAVFAYSKPKEVFLGRWEVRFQRLIACAAASAGLLRICKGGTREDLTPPDALHRQGVTGVLLRPGARITLAAGNGVPPPERGAADVRSAVPGSCRRSPPKRTFQHGRNAASLSPLFTADFALLQRALPPIFPNIPHTSLHGGN